MALAGLPGCAHSVVAFADGHQMTVDRVEGHGFEHLVIRRTAPSTGIRLHVYIEGDGLPWIGNLPSRDPSPINTLALKLANQDPTEFVYVGRPCYFTRAAPVRCTPRYWTSHRYGEEVLQSMAHAIERVREPRHAEIVLIGYSGGGALAALLESRIEGVIGVLTVAANLDIDAWTEFHDYDPLTGSLNPIRQSRDPDIFHLQLVGSSDIKVPAATSNEYAQIQPNVELREFEEFGHVCCWEEAWPEILQDFSARINERVGP